MNDRDELRPPFLSVRAAWFDAHMVDLEVRLATDDGWGGVVGCYAVGPTVSAEARRLEHWARRPEGDTIVEIGFPNGPGWSSFRFYLADLAGHIGCEVKLGTTEEGTGKPERRISLAIRTEPGLVERFARHLASVAETLEGEAVLVCV